MPCMRSQVFQAQALGQEVELRLIEFLVFYQIKIGIPPPRIIIEFCTTSQNHAHLISGERFLRAVIFD